jgi:hypothetical protein
VAFLCVVVALPRPLAAADSAPLPTAAEVAIRFVRPSATDAAITTFDQPHRIYLRPAGVPTRGELLLWIPGTMPPPPAGGKAPAAEPSNSREGSAAFCALAAQLGYDVISLRYPNALSASAARGDDADEFERFRMAIIAGGTSKHITIARVDSIEHRLIALLHHLAAHHPAEGWSNYLNGDGTIRWEKLALAGQSQGGGHAALIASHHRVARVICTGAPKDYNRRLDAPAAWLAAESATPRNRYFTFNHRQDRQAATLEQQLRNLRAMKLDAFGAPVDVDGASPPFQHSRILLTNYPGGALDSGTAHTAVITFRNAAVFTPVWRYLLTEPVE